MGDVIYPPQFRSGYKHPQTAPSWVDPASPELGAKVIILPIVRVVRYERPEHYNCRSTGRQFLVDRPRALRGAQCLDPARWL